MPGSLAPSLSRIYSAFDAEARRLFCVAMRCSRGGVVRVADLLRALAECVPHVCRDLRLTLPRPDVDHNGTETARQPLTNEPQVNRLLTLAFRIADEQPDGPVRLTPAVLAAAVAMSRPAPGRLPLPDVFTLLQLRCPGTPPFGNQHSAAHHHQSLTAPPSAEHPPPPAPQSAVATGELIEAALNRWLDARQLPPGANQQLQLSEVASLVRRVQSAPLPAKTPTGDSDFASE